METRNGIYYDLNNSRFKFKDPETNIIFIFSSDLHLVKFQEQYLQHRKEQNTKLISRFRINIDFKILADILLYKKIETRGFLIINEKGGKICLENLLLNGEVATHKN